MNVRHILFTLLLLATQVLVFNHIHILGYGIPMVCLFPILLFPLETARWKVLLFSFALGFACDVFSNTPGLSAATFTLIGMIQPHLLGVFLPREEDSAGNIRPSYTTIGGTGFVRYVLLATLVQAVCYFLLESFSFSNYVHLGLEILSGWAMTTMFILAIESIRAGTKRKGQ